MIKTNKKCFSEIQLNEFKGSVSDVNFEILKDHICNPELACMISGFKEENGIIIFKIGREYVSVKAN